MKKIKYLLFLLLFMPCIIFAAGSVKVSTTSISVEVGKTATFKITANNSTGKVLISSSDSTIASVNKSSIWVDKDSQTITVTGKQVGTATISVKLDDVATYDSQVLNNTYKITVKVTGKKSTNNYLSSLTVNGKEISGFSKTKTSYVLATTTDSKITIGATAEDKSARVSGIGSKSLAYGANTFNVVVTSESGSKRTYKVTINRKDERNSNNYLKTLTIKGYTLNPPFKSTTTSYTLDVDDKVDKITIEATLDDKTSTFVKGEGPRTVDLKKGENVIKISVKSENEKTKTYTINVIRGIATEEEPEENNNCKCEKCETYSSAILIHRIIISVLVLALIGESIFLIIKVRKY